MADSVAPRGVSFRFDETGQKLDNGAARWLIDTLQYVDQVLDIFTGS
jgi:hypothetical protein